MHKLTIEVKEGDRKIEVFDESAEELQKTFSEWYLGRFLAHDLQEGGDMLFGSWELCKTPAEKAKFYLEYIYGTDLLTGPVVADDTAGFDGGIRASITEC